MHNLNMYVDIQKRKQNETCGQRKCWINKDRNKHEIIQNIQLILSILPGKTNCCQHQVISRFSKLHLSTKRYLVRDAV